MIILIGASASGKTEVAKYLCRHFNYKKFVTTTTRPIRVNEVNGIDYNFLTVDAFNTKIKNNEFIEYTTYNSNLYGTEKRLITDDSVLIVEPAGLKVFLSLNDNKIISFFLDSSATFREAMMKKRGDKPIDIKNRLKNDDNIFNDEIKNISHYVIDSDHHSIEEMAKEIDKIYKNVVNIK